MTQTSNQYRESDFIEKFISICDVCLKPIPATFIRTNQGLVSSKRCFEHGHQEAVLYRHEDYYQLVKQYKSYGQPRAQYDQSMIKTCEVDCCFTCSAHKTNTAAVIVELLDACNMTCPTCVASSSPTAGNIKSLADIEKTLDWISGLNPMPPAIMLSGGEPTIHPEILDIVKLVRSYKFPHVFLISNGVRLAEDVALVSELGSIPNLEIYLQFDSLDDSVLKNLRGSPLSGVRKQALKNLADANIPATLVCIVKNGVNQHEIGSTIAFAMADTNIRGVTFQPLRFMGRTLGSDPLSNSITLDDVRVLVSESSPLSLADMQPHILSPQTICAGYIDRRDGRSMTKSVNDWSRQESGPGGHLYVPPGATIDGISYDHLFRVVIVAYLDPMSFSTSAAQSSIISFAGENEQLVPIDTYYLFYKGQDSQQQELIQIGLL